MRNYTKAQLELLILSQLATIDTAQEQLRLMQERNDLLEAENKKLKAQLHPVKRYRKIKTTD